MKSKKIRSLFCAAALTLSLAACGSKTSDCSGQTITGEITDIDGTAVTMQLGGISSNNAFNAFHSSHESIQTEEGDLEERVNFFSEGVESVEMEMDRLMDDFYID